MEWKRYAYHKWLDWLFRRQWKYIMSINMYHTLKFPQFDKLEADFAMRQCNFATILLGKRVYVNNAVEKDGSLFHGEIVNMGIQYSAHPHDSLFTLLGVVQTNAGLPRSERLDELRITKDTYILYK